MHKKQRGKKDESNAESNTNINTNIIHSPIKIKILLAYLEKILYLWAEGKVRGYKKTRSWKGRAQDTYTAEYRRKQNTLLDDIQLNERCFGPECNFGK